MKSLWIARHGETDWSAAGKHTGSTDLDLNAEGVEQGRALGPKIHGVEFALVLTSPLARARYTAALAGFPEAEIEDDLKEFLYGAYEGLTTKEITAQRPDWNIWREGCPGGETYEEVGRRVDRVLDRLRDVEGDVLVFSHGHTTRVLAARFTRLDELAERLGKPAPSSISILGYDHARPVIQKWNQV